MEEVKTILLGIEAFVGIQQSICESEDFLALYKTPKVYCLVYNSPLLDPTLNQINLVWGG
jgi:hypothetical protein